MVQLQISPSEASKSFFEMILGARSAWRSRAKLKRKPMAAKPILDDRSPKDTF
jgi:hypothetical protein